MLPFRNSPAGDLTLAQQKRLEMARALASDPKLLLLDELMAGLTATEVAEAMSDISQIRAKGVTVLMIEHVMQAVMKISDRIVVLDYGQQDRRRHARRSRRQPESDRSLSWGRMRCCRLRD